MFFNNFIESITREDLFIYVPMVCLFFAALFIKREKSIILANFIAALGMIGTFLGICVGLSDFNPNDITKSIPILLQGMKTAFYTSLWGMILSLIIKFLNGFKKENLELTSSEEAIIKQTEVLTELLKLITKMENISNKNNDHLYNILIENREQNEKILNSLQICENLTQLETMKNALKDIDKHITDINKAVGDNINTQIEKTENIYTSLNEHSVKTKEHNENLIEEFRKFALTMAENNNKAFIEALNKSMKDLNANLTEQFGENFKELNEAVFKLVEWQEHYKDTVIQTTENQKVIFNGINQAKDDLSKFTEESKKVVNIASDLSEIVQTAHQEQQSFNDEVKILHDINTSAKELIPNLVNINNTIDKDLAKFKTSLETLGVNTEVVTNKISKNMENIYISFNQHTSKFIEDYKAVVSESIQEIKKADLNLTTETKASVNNVIKEVNTLNEKTLKDSQKIINKHLADIDILVKTSIDSMGQLATSMENESKHITTKTSESIEKMNNDINTQLQQKVQGITGSLEVALNESLRTLGSQLALLSNKFVEDYTPLTERLREIVQISKGVRR